jgi:hypothetical protein
MPKLSRIKLVPTQNATRPGGATVTASGDRLVFSFSPQRRRMTCMGPV